MNAFLFGFLAGVLLGILAGIFITGIMTISKMGAYRERIAELEHELTQIEEEWGDVILVDK